MKQYQAFLLKYTDKEEHRLCGYSTLKSAINRGNYYLKNNKEYMGFRVYDIYSDKDNDCVFEVIRQYAKNTR